MSSINGSPLKIQLDRLLYTHYQHPDLALAHSFFTDFGFIPVQQKDEIIYYRGFGENPIIYVAEKSPDGEKGFVGGGFLVRERQDLERASHIPGASGIQEFPGPGKGYFVDVKDPQGTNIRLHHGVIFRSEEEQKRETPKPVIFNTWEEKPRKGEFQRLNPGPSRVHKLGHYGVVVEKPMFESTVIWYLNTFTLAKTDILYDPGSGEDMMVFMHIDKGEEYTDHHSFFVQTPLGASKKNHHVDHSSFETDNMDSQLVGHYWLADKGWTNCWGVGRHLLGSQIFDYWFDPSGNVVEHYSDGDLVNSKTKVNREIATPENISIWGPDVPVAFLTHKPEDAAKGAATFPAPKTEPLAGAA